MARLATFKTKVRLIKYFCLWLDSIEELLKLDEFDIIM